MAIKQLQQRLTQVGVIRLGEQRVSKKGSRYPAKLETLRITTPSKSIADAVAATYGGQVRPWQAPTGPQWEVITQAKEMPVLVPPQRIDPNMEMWGNGFRSRHCDGETETIRQVPCLCAAAQAAGQRVRPSDVCKPTTRMSLMLSEIPSLGTFKLESHGWNAAAELPTLAASIEQAPHPIPARLELQVREKKLFDPSQPQDKQIESRVFMVPVLHFDFVTPAQAFGGQIGAAAQNALAAAQSGRQAIEAAKVESTRRKFTPDEYLTLAEVAEDIDHVRELWTDAAHDEALTDEVKAALNERVAAIRKATETPAPAPQPPTDVVVDAEIVDGADAVWAQIQAVAGEKGWNADALEQRVCALLNKSSNDADEAELGRFLTAVEAGEVA